jgi:hypothetical protein
MGLSQWCLGSEANDILMRSRTMSCTKGRNGVLEFCVVVLAVAIITKTAQTQSGAPTGDARSAQGVSHTLTSRQLAQIERAKRDVSRLELDLYKAQQRLWAYRNGLSSPDRDVAGTPGGATVAFISGVTALTEQAKTVGFEAGDSVVFLRKDVSGHQYLTGVGAVVEVHEDYLSLRVSSGKSGTVGPGDTVYVADRSGSPSSLVKCFN